LRWRFDGFSGVRASFLQVPLKIFEKCKFFCAEERTTALWEAKSITRRKIEMLWTTLAAGLIGGGFFLWLIYRHLKSRQKDDPDIAY
jgi:hypothetical protein